MRYRPTWMIWLSLLTGAAWASGGPAAAQLSRSWQRADKSDSARPSTMSTPTQIPLDEVAPAARDKVRAILERPTLCTRGQPETFTCEPKMYQWVLDHPDRAAVAWRRLGAKVVDITNRGNGMFSWSDNQGSEVRWQTVYRGQNMRVWHAEGKVRPGALLPLVSVQAVLVLHHTDSRDDDGQPILRHQAELILHTDSKAMALATRVVGASAPHMAEQYISQVEMFFSALAWYLDQHPDKVSALLAETK